MSMSISCSPASPGLTGTVLRSLYRERMSGLYGVEKCPDPGTAGGAQRRCHAPDFCGLTTCPVSITSAAKPETPPPPQRRKDAVPIGGKVPAGAALGFPTAKKPWLFRLPTYLRPRQGTTYWASLDVMIQEPEQLWENRTSCSTYCMGIPIQMHKKRKRMESAGRALTRPWGGRV